MKCKKCNIEHDGIYGSGKFCSRSCANSRNHGAKTKESISRSLCNRSWKVISDDEIKELAPLSKSWADLQRKFSELHGISTTSNCFTGWIRNRCNALGVEYSHFKKQRRGRKPRYQLLRLLESDDRCYECSICRLSMWKNQQLTLHIDHIDGNKLNNELDNLRYLCPNCHSLTETWGFKGRNHTEDSKKKMAFSA